MTGFECRIFIFHFQRENRAQGQGVNSSERVGFSGFGSFASASRAQQVSGSGTGTGGSAGFGFARTTRLEEAARDRADNGWGHDSEERTLRRRQKIVSLCLYICVTVSFSSCLFLLSSLSCGSLRLWFGFLFGLHFMWVCASMVPGLCEKVSLTIPSSLHRILNKS